MNRGIFHGKYFNRMLKVLSSSWGYTPFDNSAFSIHGGANNMLALLSVLPRFGLPLCLITNYQKDMRLVHPTHVVIFISLH